MSPARFLPRLLLAPAALLALALAAGGRPAAVPISLSDSLTWSAPATVNGRQAQVTIDTGAGVCRFPPSLLGDAPRAGTAGGTGRPGDPAQFDLVRVPALALGAASWPGAAVASWPLLDEMHVSGVVSARLFEKTPVTLDFAARRLVFESPQGLAQRAAQGESAPVVLRREGEASLLPLVRAGVDGVPRLLVLDTGLPGALELESAAGPHTVALGGITRSGLESYQRATPGADGRLGLRFFEGRKLTLDLPGSRVILSR